MLQTAALLLAAARRLVHCIVSFTELLVVLNVLRCMLRVANRVALALGTVPLNRHLNTRRCFARRSLHDKDGSGRVERRAEERPWGQYYARSSRRSGPNGDTE